MTTATISSRPLSPIISSITRGFFAPNGVRDMGQQIQLKASDGFSLGGYRADAPGKAKGALVVIQEIFGVNHHMRNVCDRFAALGYTSLAPAIFDRAKPGVELG